MNISLAKRILTEMYTQGVREIVLCAGARNSPFVTLLAKTGAFTLYSFFEERSAGFFALGCTRRSGMPTAVITTSGTAAAELLPAMVEGFYSGFPLVAVTADRPRRLRGLGAPQAIDQVGLYKKFVNLELDLEGNEAIDLQSWNRRDPLHLNVCFDEPLLDESIEQWWPEKKVDVAVELDAKVPKSFQNSNVSTNVNETAQHSGVLRAAFVNFLSQARKPVAIVATLDTLSERTAVRELLLKLKIPVFLEATSGLREDPQLSQYALRSGDQILNWALKNGEMDAVLRIGGIPTVRVWRDLDEATCAAKVLSLSRLPFSGLSRGEILSFSDLGLVINRLTESLSSSNLGVDNDNEVLRKGPGVHSELWHKDRAVAETLFSLLCSGTKAEPAMFRALSEMIPESSLVYVGNSLPIREWDLAASFEKHHWVRANRGVNGIDGQFSTFLGMTKPGEPAYVIVGDLTALYDLTAPWVMRHLRGRNIRFILMNNGGGRIFSRIFRTDLFENSHGLEFSHWAKMWDLSYSRCEDLAKLNEFTTDTVFELVPDAEATKTFWDTYDRLWKNP